ncbi:LolA family protein [Christiangramia salexigens]|uniref:Lipoprotein carrier protein n=1 Tax=Christiangramia salexigens TaxID=1913577 RepID=A0A1L3J317_9FLAO|nr:outer membrane lipoprotein carrier protein LolA [Christiangramia salexigens]APG59511.1 lipoprotein carrier protein [Christiangramia salexigens]
MRILSVLLLLLSLNMFGQSEILNKTEENLFKTKVLTKASEINSLSADFIQLKHLAMLAESPQSRGKVYFTLPDLLKWEYTYPYDYEVIFNGSRLFLKEEGQVSEVDLSANKTFGKMGQLVAGSLNGKILLATLDFDITYHKIKGDTKARIIPRNKELLGMFKEIWVSFNSDYLIRMVLLVDPSGDTTEILLKNIKINQPINPSVFQN